MTVLCYHSVDPGWESPLAVEPDRFALHARWLSRQRTVLPLADAVHRMDAAGRLPRRLAALTFDDGFSGVTTYAAPVLARFGLPATVFLVAETLTRAGRPVDWVDTPGHQPPTTLQRDQVLDLQAAGITFESHSWAHRDLTALGFDACVRDLRDSRQLLSDLLGRPVTMLAYPRGRHDADVRAAAQRAGYQYAFALPERAEPPGPFALPRVGVHRGNGVATLAIKCAPGYLSARHAPALVGAHRGFAGLVRRGRSGASAVPR